MKLLRIMTPSDAAKLNCSTEIVCTNLRREDIEILDNSASGSRHATASELNAAMRDGKVIIRFDSKECRKANGTIPTEPGIQITCSAFA